MIQGFRLRRLPFTGGLGEVEKGLARQFRNARIGVPKKGDQHAEPTQLSGFNSDYGNGFGHSLCLFCSSCRPEFANLESGTAGRESFQNSQDAPDKNIVSAFLKDAEEIFQTARQGGREDCELAILVGRDGGIHMLAGSGWELEPLRLHHGAKAAYRITRNGGGVRLEARSADEACLLQAKPAQPWRATLPDFPQYLTSDNPGIASFPAAGR